MNRSCDMDTARVIWLWGPALAVMVAIFCISSMSSPPRLSDVPDVSAHVVAYAALGISLLRGFADAQWDRVTLRSTLLAVAFAVLYGLTDELHQWFVPGRTPELRDLIADSCGAGFASGLIWAWSIVLANREK